MALKRAMGVDVQRSGFGIFATYEVRSGQRVLVRLKRRAYAAVSRRVEAEGAAVLADDRGRTLWATADGYFWDDDELEAEEVALLVWDRARRQEARIDRLRTVRATEEAVTGARRERIPDDTRLFVWQRDGGCCVRCGAEDDLQFDHLIPVARGGGNAAENVQILCGSCNRAKSDHIA
ncbi:MAG: HNH endonuclease [Chloroflexi bacterium]|nr:HNH endonuclease [Chloroflexota bacterium]